MKVLDITIIHNNLLFLVVKKLNNESEPLEIHFQMVYDDDIKFDRDEPLNVDSVECDLAINGSGFSALHVLNAFK